MLPHNKKMYGKAMRKVVFLGFVQYIIVKQTGIICFESIRPLTAFL